MIAWELVRLAVAGSTAFECGYKADLCGKASSVLCRINALLEMLSWMMRGTSELQETVQS